MKNLLSKITLMSLVFIAGIQPIPAKASVENDEPSLTPSEEQDRRFIKNAACITAAWFVATSVFPHPLLAVINPMTIGIVWAVHETIKEELEIRKAREERKKWLAELKKGDGLNLCMLGLWHVFYDEE
jgi:hypothetical protein